MALAQTQAEARKGTSAKTPAGPELRGNAASLAAAFVLMLTFMGATLPTPLYVIYRDELHFSQITLTLIYAVYFGGALATAFFLGRLSDETGRRVAIFAAVALSMIATVEFIFADSLPMLFLARLMSGLGIPLAAGAGTAWVAELCEGRCAAARLSRRNTCRARPRAAHRRHPRGICAGAAYFAVPPPAPAWDRRRGNRLALPGDGETSGAGVVEAVITAAGWCAPRYRPFLPRAGHNGFFHLLPALFGAGA